VARTLIAGALLLIGGACLLFQVTLGGQAFTQETARRVAIRAQPQPVPPVELQLQDGQIHSIETLAGRLIVATFMYTDCHDSCPAVGANMAAVRADLRDLIDQDRLHFISISFNPNRDTPEQLAGYASNFRATTDHWWVARPTGNLDSLLREFGVTVLPVAERGFMHNSAFYLIDQDLKWVDLFADDDVQSVKQAIRERL